MAPASTPSTGRGNAATVIPQRRRPLRLALVVQRYGEEINGGAEYHCRIVAEHLSKQGMSGYVHDTLEKARQFDAASPGGKNAVKTRRDSIREMATARALYRCGDYGDLGRKTLERYVEDLRGHIARHAKAVLEKPPGPPESKRRAF